MLPSRLNRVLFRPRRGEDRLQVGRQHVSGWPRQAEVMELAVRVAKAEDQGRLRKIAGDADDSAVGRALPLHLYPLPFSGHVATIAAFGHHALQTWQNASQFSASSREAVCATSCGHSY